MNDFDLGMYEQTDPLDGGHHQISKKLILQVTMMIPNLKRVMMTSKILLTTLVQ